MVENGTEQLAVVKVIQSMLASHYTVVSNIAQEQHHIGGFFPDIIVMDKDNGNALFAIEVRKNGQVSHCIQQWKSVTPHLPATLYIVVPEAELENAQAIAAVNGLKAKFGTYKMKSDGGVANVNFL
ncbi:MAG: hypothetical protein J0L87_12830 [Bacteroidetes bacterium]|nr:hypothetical protein [Bacteroidota bacterium]